MDGEVRRKHRFGGVIAVAGLSSRMHGFKPFLLLPDGGRVLAHTVKSLKNADIAKILAVVGHRGEEVDAFLSGLGVPAVYNSQYHEGSMLESVKLGLRKLPGVDAVLMLPGDVPLVRRHSMRALMRTFAKTGAPVVYPVYEEKRGHPPLIAASAFEAVLDYNGQEGLRGALRPLESAAQEALVPDPFVLMDVDTPEDYKRLYACAQHAQTPFEEVCAAIWNWAGTPEQVREHCRMVAQTAGMLAQRLNAVGHPVEVALVRSGALLHDVAKAYPRHIERGARMLRVLGYPKVAAVMETHNDLPAASQCALDARALVFLADKLVSGAEVVGLDVRFARTFQKYAENPAAAENIRRRKRIAQEVAERVADRLGVGNIDEILKGM